MGICIPKGLCDPLSRDESLNSDNAFCFGLILMPNLSMGLIGCWNSLLILISGLYKYV